jgi:hypothetical protein
MFIILKILFTLRFILQTLYEVVYTLNSEIMLHREIDI